MRIRLNNNNDKMSYQLPRSNRRNYIMRRRCSIWSKRDGKMHKSVLIRIQLHCPLCDARECKTTRDFCGCFGYLVFFTLSFPLCILILVGSSGSSSSLVFYTNEMRVCLRSQLSVDYCRIKVQHGRCGTCVCADSDPEYMYAENAENKHKNKIGIGGTRECEKNNVYRLL